MSIVGQVTFGLLGHVPGDYGLLARRARGTGCARHCHSVRLRYPTLAHQRGLAPTTPASVGELGPGDTLDTGLAALLPGPESYIALGVVQRTRAAATPAVFEKPVGPFRSREPMPTDDEFPLLKPRSVSFSSPRGVPTEGVLRRSLAPPPLNWLRRAIEGLDGNTQSAGSVTYCAPRDPAEPSCLPSDRMEFSQAVLESVCDPEALFAALNRWIAAGGFISHQVDASSHGKSRTCGGHWAYSISLWRPMRGNRPCLLDSLPCSAYVRLLEDAGFDVVHVAAVRDRPPRKEPAGAPVQKTAGRRPRDASSLLARSEAPRRAPLGK